jgi:hypothetical protein
MNSEPGEKYDIVVFENMTKKITKKEIENFLESSKIL